MTHPLITAWFTFCGAEAPRENRIPQSWLRMAELMEKADVTVAELELVALWMRREIKRAQDGQRGVTAYNSNSLTFSVMFPYGKVPPGDELARFLDVLGRAQAALAGGWKPALKHGERPQNVVDMPKQDDAEIERIRAAADFSKIRDAIRHTMNNNEIRIGNIGNYYGGLWIKTEDGKHYWAVENYDGKHWTEITESLYRALSDYENARQSRIGTDKP